MTELPIGCNFYFAPPRLRPCLGKSVLIAQIVNDAGGELTIHYGDPKAGDATLDAASLARRTVRITYRRASDMYEVTVVRGDERLEWVCTVIPGQSWAPDKVHAYVESQAAKAARDRGGLGISRLDVP